MLLFLRSVSSPGDLNLSRDGIFGWNWFHYRFFFFLVFQYRFEFCFIFYFFFFWFNNLHANLHSCYNSNFCAMKFSLLSEKRIAWFCIADSKRFFFLCMFFGMIENLKIFFFSSFLCKLNNFFSLNFVRRWISTVWEILLSLKYVYDD